MGLLNKLTSFLSGSGEDRNTLWIYVQCEACGEVIASRINLLNDLSVTYSGGGKAFQWRKQLIGSKRHCYKPIAVELEFDDRRMLTWREIDGGEFVTREEYLVQEEEGGE